MGGFEKKAFLYLQLIFITYLIVFKLKKFMYLKKHLYNIVNM